MVRDERSRYVLPPRSLPPWGTVHNQIVAMLFSFSPPCGLPAWSGVSLEHRSTEASSVVAWGGVLGRSGDEHRPTGTSPAVTDNGPFRPQSRTIRGRPDGERSSLLGLSQGFNGFSTTSQPAALFQSRTADNRFRGRLALCRARYPQPPCQQRTPLHCKRSKFAHPVRIIVAWAPGPCSQPRAGGPCYIWLRPKAAPSTIDDVALCCAGQECPV